MFVGRVLHSRKAKVIGTNNCHCDIFEPEIGLVSETSQDAFCPMWANILDI